ncbi:MAG: peptide chain release factor N(5)-glutamine methyltransferase [Bacteroidota bacterium]
MAEKRKDWTVLHMLEWATAYFKDAGVNQPRLSIEWLLACVLDVKRLDLYLMYDRPLMKVELDRLRAFVKRRALHEPLQYITGSTDFFGLTIHVEQGVLIPRPETEELVESIVNEVKGSSQGKVIDLGTGSGCIALALAHTLPGWEVSATDVSEDALKIARQNGSRLGLTVHWVNHSWLEPDSGIDFPTFDVVVSNPPYILNDERPDLDKEVRDYEPGIALFCESTDYIYSGIEQFANKHLAPKGVVFLELHEQHAQEVASLFSLNGWKCDLIQDLGGKNRFLKARRNGLV